MGVKKENSKKDKKYVVEKSNPLLEAKNNMTLQQLRLFDIYLACINPLDEATKHVSIPLQTVAGMLGVELNEKSMHMIGRACMMLYIDLVDFDKEAKQRGEMRLRHMFQCFDVSRNKEGQWMVEIEADRDILPYLFQIKEMGYLKYSLWNVLRLSSKIAMKLYEVCKAGYGLQNYRIKLDDLKARLGVSSTKSYTQYKQFKQAVLNRALKEINEKTDIKVTFEEIRGFGKGRPVQAIHFIVQQNPDFVDPLNPELPAEIPADDEVKKEELTAEDTENAEKIACYAEYAEMLPDKVKNSRVYKAEELERIILTAFPGATLSQQLNLLKIATNRYLPHRNDEIKSHPRYYKKILQNVLEEILKENSNINKDKPKQNMFLDFDQRDANYDNINEISQSPQSPDPEHPEGQEQKKTFKELLEEIKNMPKKNECE